MLRQCWGTVSTPEYTSQSGRLAKTTVKVAEPAPTGTTIEQSFTYDDDGKLLTVELGTTNVATATYNNPSGEGIGTGLLEAVVYGNGVHLDGLTRDATGAQTAMTWNFPGAQDEIKDAVVRSQSGRIVRNTVTEGGVTGPSSTYAFDGAGRLVTAAIPRHERTYEYDNAGCGS